MVRIVMMYYINVESFFNQPEANFKIMFERALNHLLNRQKTNKGIAYNKKQVKSLYFNRLESNSYGLPDSNKWEYRSWRIPTPQKRPAIDEVHINGEQLVIF